MIKTPQFAHQAEVYEAHRDDHFFALFWEMGLGKSKMILDVASHLHAKGQIDVLFVVAPNAVYKNWLSQEVPPHLGAPFIAMAHSRSNSSKTQLKQLLFLDPEFEPKKLRFFCTSYDALGTERGFEFAQRLLKIHRGMLVADESTAIKSPMTVRAKRMKAIGKLAPYRWIATGTPAAQSPFDLHSQIEFLSPEFWGQFGLKTMNAFKNEFGEFTLRKISGGRQFQELKAYRRLDVLQKLIAPISSRLLKEDSTVKLPPKTYAIRSFELSDSQKKLYGQLKYEFEAELDGGMYLEAPLAIVRLARLQQITSGFVTAEERTMPHGETQDDHQLSWDCPLNPIAQELVDNDFSMGDAQVILTSRKVVDVVPPEHNPRLLLLLELLEECSSQKSIVWCRFRRDVDLITAALGDSCVRYDGAVSSADRVIALDRFRDPNDKARVFVANVHAISQGVTLTIAKTMIYYSNSFSLEKRLQSEDRNHRIGQDMPVLIIDIAAEGTVDERVIESLRTKFDIAASVTGDRLREWIR
jgi:SNF2 family DNA or RNA helicase